MTDVLRPASTLRSERVNFALLGSIVMIATAVYTIFALRIGNFQDDEALYMTQARFVATHFPSALWQSVVFPRGIQRLDPLLLATPFSFMRGPGAFEFDHVVQCVLFASTAIPVFLMARGAGLPRVSQLIAAALSVAIPWGVVSGSFLAESAAYPAYAWALYAVWSTCVRPRARNDLLAAVALVFAALSRTGMLALVPLLPAAVLWQELRWQLRGRGAVGRLRALPGELWRGHRVLTVLVALGILVYLAGVSKSLTGQYGVPHVGPLDPLFERYRYYLSRVVVGTGLLAVAVGLPWTVRTLVRPRDGARHALAVVSVLGILCMLLSLLSAGPDERYVMYGAIPVALMFAGALRERIGWGIVLSALVVDLLINGVSWPEASSPYDFFTYPAAVFYKRVLLRRVGRLDLPISPERFVEAALIVLGLVLLGLSRRRRAAQPVAVVLGVGVLAFCALQTLYNLQKYVTGAGGGPPAAQRSWVDEHVPPGARVGALAISLGASGDYQPVWEATEFWNTSVGLDVYFGYPGYLPFPLGSEAMRLTIEPVSGRIHAFAGPGIAVPTAAPEYMLVPLQGTNAIVLAGTVVAQSSWVPVQLLRLSRPARALWSIGGTDLEGFLTSGAAATATVFSAALAGTGPWCASFSLISPPEFSGRWPYEARSGHNLRRGWLRANRRVEVEVPLAPSSSPHGTSATVSVAVRGQAKVLTSVVSAKLAFFNIARCQNRAG